MEGPGSIEGREDLAACKSGQIVRDVEKREGVLLGHCVEFPVVDSPLDLLAVLLWNGDKRKRPRRVGLFHNPLFQPPINLLSQGFLHDRVQRSVFHLDWLGPWMDVDGVRDEIGLAVPANRDDIGELQ